MIKHNVFIKTDRIKLTENKIIEKVGDVIIVLTIAVGVITVMYIMDVAKEMRKHK